MRLYHGTNQAFAKFDPKKLNSDCAIDQYGSGFYFFDTAGPTVRYGNVVIVAECKIKELVDLDKSHEHCLQHRQVEELLCKSPDLDLHLSNFGDLEYESFDHVLSRAAEMYSGQDILLTLNKLGNDFFRKESCYLLLRAFAEMIGINCMMKQLSGGNIYVMLDDRDIEIVQVTDLEELADDHP